MKKIIALGFVSGFLPLVASAAYAGQSTITTILNKLMDFLAYFVPALVTIAVIYFIWGVIQYMTSSDEEAKKLSRTKIINGLIGLFVIVAFWGIIRVVKNTFDIGNTTGDNIIPLTPLNE